MEIIDKKIEYVECVACEEYVETFNHNESSDMCNDCHAESILCRICYKLVSPDQFRAVRNQCNYRYNIYQCVYQIGYHHDDVIHQQMMMLVKRNLGRVIGHCYRICLAYFSHHWSICDLLAD